MRMIVAICSALWCAGAAQAQVYKCVDAGGKTVYSQAPCPKSAKATTLKSTAPAAAPLKEAKAGDAAGKTSGPRTAADMEQDFRKRQLEQEEVRKKQEQTFADAKVKEENCRNARNNLAMLELGGRQARINDKGERYFLDDAQIETEKQRARAAVQSSCG